MSNLLRVSEAASLGIHTMALLAKAEGKYLSNAEIAEALHGSGNTLAKVLQRLVRAGLVDSVRGPGGGFALRRSADDLTLLEIFEAIEGPLDPPHCLLGAPICGGNECALGCMIHSVSREMAQHLAETTLAELAASVCIPAETTEPATASASCE